VSFALMPPHSPQIPFTANTFTAMQEISRSEAIKMATNFFIDTSSLLRKVYHIKVIIVNANL
jgi:hypothetical protein